MKAHKRLMRSLEALANPGAEEERRRLNRLAGRGNFRGRYEVRRTPSRAWIAFHPDSRSYLGPTPDRAQLDFLMERSDDLLATHAQMGRVSGCKPGPFLLCNQDSVRHERQQVVWKDSIPV